MLQFHFHLHTHGIVHDISLDANRVTLKWQMCVLHFWDMSPLTLNMINHHSFEWQTCRRKLCTIAFHCMNNAFQTTGFARNHTLRLISCHTFASHLLVNHKEWHKVKPDITLFFPCKFDLINFYFWGNWRCFGLINTQTVVVHKFFC